MDYKTLYAEVDYKTLYAEMDYETCMLRWTTKTCMQVGSSTSSLSYRYTEGEESLSGCRKLL